MARSLEIHSQGESKQLHLGRFELLNELGQGGFGTVYKARDTQLNRIVALKIPHSGALVTAEQKTQFLREAQKAAGLEHAGIVPVFDAGEVSGIPFIASQLVKGKTLGHYMSATRVPYRDCAEIVARVADALQHAHDRMLVHRDVKPGNIMLGDDGRPMLMDFGLAIDVERDNRITSDGRVKGTPAYMSPEQAAGENRRIDHRTDIYSLGVVLFELLTGERPFHGVHQKIIDHIRFDEPRSLRSFNSRIPVDLQTICQKAMEKVPSRRYQTAREFSEDLRRWLGNEPIRARRIGRVGRFVRWCRRHPGVTASLSSIFLILTVASIVSFRLYLNERVALVGERAAVREANQRSSRLSVTSAEQFMKQDIMAAVPWLAEAYRLDKGDETRESISRLRLQCALRACPRLERVWFHDAPVSHLAVSRDRRRFASASKDGLIRAWDVESGKLIHEFSGHKQDLEELKFSPDGRYLISAEYGGSVRVWNVESGRQAAELTHSSEINDLDVSPSGEIIATGHRDNRARLWTWQKGGPHSVRELVQGGIVNTLAFNPQGTQLATGGYHEAIRIWNPLTGEPLEPKLAHGGTVSALGFSHDGHLLAAVSSDAGLSTKFQCRLQVWDADTFQPRFATPPAIQAPLSNLQFSPDDTRIAALAEHGLKASAIIWNVSDGKQAIPWLPHDRTVSQIDFSPAGTLLLTACRDGCVRVWDTRSGTIRSVPLRQGGPVLSARFLDNERIIAAGDDRCVRQWKIKREETTVSLGPHTLVDAALSPDGRHLLVGSKDRTARVHDLDGRPVDGLQSVRQHGTISSVAYNLDGTQFATGSADGVARVWDAKDGSPVMAPLSHSSPVGIVRFSPAGDQLATVCQDHIARIWNCSTGKIENQYEHPSTVSDVAFSPSGELIATACDDVKVFLWRRGQGPQAQLATTLPHPEPVRHLVYHPTEDLLLTIAGDNILRVWDCNTYELLASFAGHTGRVARALFSPDGNRFISLSEDGTARIWDTRAGTAAAPAISFGSTVRDASFSRDGRFVVCGGRDQTVRVWNTLSGEPVSPPLVQPDEVIRCFFCPDSLTIVVVTQKGSLFKYSLADRADDVHDPELEAELMSGHRVREGGGSVAIDPREYRALADPQRTRIDFPQLTKP